MKHYDYLITGAGISGLVAAERLAKEGLSSLVIDKRDHIGGNCYDEYDEHGVLIHRYGPHYFRTQSKEVVDYLSQFTEWIPAHYRVLSHIQGTYYQFPINLTTFEQIMGRSSSEAEMEATLKEWRHDYPNPSNSEEAVLAQVGEKLYRMFYEGYTTKQWKCSPKELDPSVCQRIPIRTNRDDRYLTEEFQMMPKQGYTAMFQKMIGSSPLIEIQLQTSLEEIRAHTSFGSLIYTGPIDRYFNDCLGKLPYRSLRFEHEHYPHCDYYQETVQVNYPNEEKYTRIVETKHITQQQIKGTTITKEYPQDIDSSHPPYYPIPNPESKALYQQYAQLAKQESQVYFIGRLAKYRYYNMDQVVAMALQLVSKLTSPGP